MEQLSRCDGQGDGACCAAGGCGVGLVLDGSRCGAAGFSRFIAQGVDADDPTKQVNNQVLLGDEAFVEKAIARAGKSATEVPKRQRRPQSLARIAADARDRDATIRTAYQSGNFTLKEIGDHFGLHYATVSRLARK